MRAFIAVDLPPDLLKKIGTIIEFFRKELPERSIKWVSVEKLHLTIKFIGELPEENLNDAKAIILDAVTNLPSFKISIQGLGMYPNKQKPRVVWLGITGKEALVEIYRILNNALAEIGIQPERRKFNPHLTLGRIRRGTDQAIVREIGQTLSQFTVDSLGTVLVEHISLYKSKLTPQGPIYTLLQTTPLNKV